MRVCQNGLHSLNDSDLLNNRSLRKLKLIKDKTTFLNVNWSTLNTSTFPSKSISEGLRNSYNHEIWKKSVCFDDLQIFTFYPLRWCQSGLGAAPKPYNCGEKPA